MDPMSYSSLKTESLYSTNKLTKPRSIVTYAVLGEQKKKRVRVVFKKQNVSLTETFRSC